MTERQVNMNYLKGKYISPTWENMLEECQNWYKEGLKQGKFDKKADKQQLISFLEIKIKESKKKAKEYEQEREFDWQIYEEHTVEICQEVLDFVKGNEKND